MYFEKIKTHFYLFFLFIIGFVSITMHYNFQLNRNSYAGFPKEFTAIEREIAQHRSKNK